MEGKFTFEKRRRDGEENPDFQGDYMPEPVTLEDLRERMKRVADKG